MQIKGKVFVITGGGSGLGAATARRIVAAGGKTVLVDINEEAGAAMVTELGDAACFVRADVTNEDDVKVAVKTAVSQFGSLHGAINCAGIAIAVKVLGRQGIHSLEAFSKVIQINLIGTFNVIRLVAEVVAQNEPNAGGERGVFINTASVAGYDGQIGQTAYAASNGGIIAMTLPLAREFARSGMRVMTIAPGIMDTPMLAGLPEKARISLGEQVPFPSRLGNPDEYAALAEHIIENSLLNGEVIRLDGAIRMAPK